MKSNEFTTEAPRDGLKKPLAVGDYVARCTGNFGRDVTIQQVTSISANGLPCLNNSKVPAKRPDRLLKITSKKRKAGKQSVTDYRGSAIKVGDLVGKPDKIFANGDGPYMKPVTVTKILDGKVFLDNSNRAIKYPGSLVII